MASIGPLALGAKGCVERLRPTGETTHYILCVAPLLHPLLSLTHWIFRSLMLPYKSSSHSAKCVRCASLRSGGRRLAVRTAMECHFDALPCTPFCLFEAFPLKGKREVWRRKTGSHIFHVPFRNFPFGGERREPITRMPIMPYDTKSQIRNVDFISIARRAIHNPRANGPSN